jgi:hypothetical protein
VTDKYAGVAQERYLTTRTFHLAKETVFWQCLETWSSESFPNEIPVVFRMGIGLTTEMYLKKLIQTCRQTLSSPDCPEQRTGSSTISSSILDDIRSQWRCFIEYYSSYDLTKDSDIFVALQGIAQDIIVESRFVRVKVHGGPMLDGR